MAQHSTHDVQVLTLFGTRPEVIKLAPVIRALEGQAGLRTRNIFTGQQPQLAAPLFAELGVHVHADLDVMRDRQPLNALCARVLSALDPLLAEDTPDLVLVQGDTTTAVAGALAAFHRGIPVGHVEAGLRTADPANPFPEEMNRRLIGRLASLHFAATPGNAQTLIAEGVPEAEVFTVGNPVVDSLQRILAQAASARVDALIAGAAGKKCLLMTTHRRESFGRRIRENIAAVRDFVLAHEDVMLYLPVHPNPEVQGAVSELLSPHPRMRLLEPLDYGDFIHLMRRTWLVVSDSGGVQEEAPTLGVPVLVIRDNTERPEALACGAARLVGSDPDRLRSLLEESYLDLGWRASLAQGINPFGDGQSGQRIAGILAERWLANRVVPR